MNPQSTTLKRVLSREGYVVSTAENAAFALAQVRQNPPELMLTDIECLAWMALNS